MTNKRKPHKKKRNSNVLKRQHRKSQNSPTRDSKKVDFEHSSMVKEFNTISKDLLESNKCAAFVMGCSPKVSRDDPQSRAVVDEAETIDASTILQETMTYLMNMDQKAEPVMSSSVVLDDKAILSAKIISPESGSPDKVDQFSVEKHFDPRLNEASIEFAVGGGNNLSNRIHSKQTELNNNEGEGSIYAFKLDLRVSNEEEVGFSIKRQNEDYNLIQKSLLESGSANADVKLCPTNCMPNSAEVILLDDERNVDESIVEDTSASKSPHEDIAISKQNAYNNSCPIFVKNCKMESHDLSRDNQDLVIPSLEEISVEKPCSPASVHDYDGDFTIMSPESLQNIHEVETDVTDSCESISSGNDELEESALDLREQVKHPLENSWTFWYFSLQDGVSWEECQKEILSIATVEDFWCVLNWIQSPSEFKKRADYSFFRSGVRPDWADPMNKHGGRLVLSCDRASVDVAWLEILLSLVGDQWGSFGKHIMGAVVGFRAKAKVFKVELWIGTSQLNVLNRIQDQLRDVLGQGGVFRNINFKEHENYT